jgi:hypothetical protein
MFTTAHTTQNLSFNSVAFSEEPYEIQDMVAFFYKASHGRKSIDEDNWINNLEIQIERFKNHQYSQCVFSNNEVLKWRNTLSKISLAITQFETSYNANCPCAGLLPSPFIRRIHNIKQSADLALLYIEV